MKKENKKIQTLIKKEKKYGTWTIKKTFHKQDERKIIQNTRMSFRKRDRDASISNYGNSFLADLGGNNDCSSRSGYF